MKKVILFIVVAIPLFWLASCQTSGTYHVSKEGDDSNPGTENSPFLSLAKAAEVLEPGDVCIVHSGTYRECFTPKNNGTSEKPILLIAAEDEKVIITGMEAMTDWVETEKGIFKAQASWDLGESNFVLIDGKIAFEARFPNKTNDDPLDIEGGTIQEEHVSGPAGTRYPSPVRFISKTKVPGHWTSQDLSDAKVWVLAHRKWSGWTAPVTGYDPEEQLIWFKEFEGSQIKDNYNPNYMQGSYGQGVYYMFGSKVLLDAPNEWYFDKDARELHVMVEGQKKPAVGQVEFRKREVAVDLGDKKNWEVSGFEIVGATVNINNAENCILDNCKITYPWHSVATHSPRALSATNTGITVSGRNNTIKNSEISYTAAAAVSMSGEGITLANNFIHHLNYLGSISTGGIMIRGINHKIIYNTIHTSGRDILKFEAGGSVIAWNQMYDAGLICYDLGVLYSAGTDYRNTVIHHNLVHNGNWEHHPFNGIYFDNFTNNVIVHNNVVWGNIKTGVRSNRPGNYHVIYNNTTISIDNRWGPWKGPETQFGSSIINNYYLRPIMANEEVFQKNNVVEFPFDTLKLEPLKADTVEGYGKYGFPGYIGAFSDDSDNWTADVGHDFSRSSIPPVERELPFVRNYLKDGSFDWGRDRRGNIIEITQGEFWEKTGETELVYSPGFNHPHPDTRNSVYAISLLLKNKDAGISQTVKDLKPDFPHKVGVYVRPYGNAEAIMSIQSGSLSYEVSSEEVPTIEGWKLLVLAFRTGPEATEARVRIRKTGDGDVYLDNAGLLPDLEEAENLSTN